MERYDAEKAARVWQRVRGEQEQSLSGLPGMAAAEQNAAERFRQLQRQQPHRILEELAGECAENAAVLRGLCRLLDQPEVPAASVQQAMEVPEIALRRCYVAAAQMLVSCEKYADHPEYGPVFRELAHRKRRHCFRIPALLGRQNGQRMKR